MSVYSGRIIDYLGYGLAASRPSAPPTDPLGTALWWSYDTLELDLYDWNTSSWKVISSGGAGGVVSLNSLTGALSVTSPDGSITVGTSGSDVTVELPVAPTCNETQVAASASAVELLASNALRVAAVLYNSSGQTLYIGSDNTVTTGTYLWNVPPGTNWTLPVKYTGAL